MDFSTLIKKPCFITTWKLSSGEERLDHFLAALKADPNFHLYTYLMAVPYTYLQSLKAKIESSSVILGANEMHSADPGQFTETIAGRLLSKKGASFVLIGTNEYRRLRHESQESINRKVHAALAAGVVPFLCLSESEQQALEQQSEAIIREQFEKGTAGLTNEQLKNIVIVFEAPWLETTLLELSAKMVLGRYALYRKAVAQSLGAEVADQLHYAFGFCSQIKHSESLYRHLSPCSFYARQPESLLELQTIAASHTHHAMPASEPESQAPEIILPLDVEFESELISSNIIKEALPKALASEPSEPLNPPTEGYEDEPPQQETLPKAKEP